MKRLTQLVITACALSGASTPAVEAQFSSARPVRSSRPEPRFEVAVFGGYQFGGNWDAVVGGTPGRLDVADRGNYGMSFAVRARPGVLGEFLYLRQPSTLYFQPVNGIKEEVFPVHVAYYQLGGMYEMARGRLRPFGSLSAGATHFNPKQSGFGSEWRFSVAAGLGIRAFLTERIGVRGQAHLLMPFQWAGVYCGTFGCGTSGGSAVVQGQVSGGLVVGL